MRSEKDGFTLYSCKLLLTDIQIEGVRLWRVLNMMILETWEAQ